MKRNKLNKGFTLVELLVVIAILAILATVSIVGYSSFTKKAEYSNDVSLVTQWNTLLDGKDILAKANSKEKLNNVNEVKEYFKENGSNDDDFIPQSDGYHFYWCETDNNVYLVEDADTDNNQFDVSFPEDNDNSNVTMDNGYRLDETYYEAELELTNCSLSKGKTIVKTGETIELIFIVDEGKSFDEYISVIYMNNPSEEVNFEWLNGKLTINNVLDNIKITVGASCCFAKGTKVTMGDGTTKNIEDVAVGDSVLTYNHEAGKYESQDVIIAFKGDITVKPVTLYFDDGTKLSITNAHCLFEKESLKYVSISRENAKSLIGNHYYSLNNNDYIELIDVVLEQDSVEYYTLYTKYNFNYFAEGLLNITEDIDAYLNFYTFNEDLSVDMEALEKDIATYGLLEYSDELGIGTKEDFDIWHAKYGNIIIGKGLMTWDDVAILAEEYKTLY